VQGDDNVVNLARGGYARTVRRDQKPIAAWARPSPPCASGYGLHRPFQLTPASVQAGRKGQYRLPPPGR
jgi:hypothetical protein